MKKEQIMIEPSNLKQFKLEQEAMEAKNNLAEILKQELTEFCYDSHGLINLVKNKNVIVRVIWLLLILTSTAYCVESIVQNMVNFLNFPVAIEYDIIMESPTEFPAVTFCNLNPFDFFNDNETTIQLLNSVLTTNNISLIVPIESYQDAMNTVETAHTTLRASVAASQKLTFPQMKTLGFQIEKMLISCSFNDQTCTPANFTWFRDFEYGNCFTFNDLIDNNGDSMPAKKTSKSGANNGLMMELYLGRSGVTNYFSIKNGIYAIVHNRTSFPLIKYQGVFVSTGVATNIGVSRAFYYKKEAPYSSCRKDPNKILPSDSEIYIETVNTTTYSQILCNEVCLQHMFILPKCGCKDPTIPQSNIYDTKKFCHTVDQFECVKKQRNYFDQNEISSLCSDYCPLECDSVQYTFTTNFAKYPSDYYFERLNTNAQFVLNTQSPPLYMYNATSRVFVNATDEYIAEVTGNNSNTGIQDSMLILNVFYDDLRTIVINELAAIELETLMGIIGGQVGLCLGATFLSVCEVVEMIARIVYSSSLYLAKRSQLRRRISNGSE